MNRAIFLLPVLCILLSGPVRAYVDSTAHAIMGQLDSSMEAAPVITKEGWAAAADDTLPLRDARFDADAIGQLRTNPGLDYDRDLHVDQLWWDRVKQWLQDRLQKLFGTRTGRYLFGHLHWAILAFALLFLAFHLRKRLFHGVFATGAKAARNVRELSDDPTRPDLDLQLGRAERAGDWRGAMRLRYLLVLRKLVDDGRITWKPESTDRDYLGQLHNSADRAAFGELSFLFKWAWYGDAPLDEARYRMLVPAFAAMHGNRPTTA